MPVPDKGSKAAPSSSGAKSLDYSISGPTTRSLRRRATSHIVDSKDQPSPGGARRISPRFHKPGGDSEGKKVLEVTGQMGRRRSPRLSASKEGAADSTAISGGSPRKVRQRSVRSTSDAAEKGTVARKVRQRSVRSTSDAAEKGTGESRPTEVCGKRNVRFEDGVHLGNGGDRKIRVVKRKVGNGAGVVKSEGGVKVGNGRNLDGRGEAMTTSVGEWEMVPCSDSGVDRDTFSTPKAMVKGKRTKSGRYQAEGVGLDLVESCGTKTWTSEQDRMLQRAYLSARPSPHFWKKVSKMVAGKTAKECFDRIHSTYITPPVLRRPMITRNTNQSPVSNFNLSGSDPCAFFEENTKPIKSKKQRKVLAQRTVRHLLRKHQLEDQGREADLFPVFQFCLDATSADTECNGPLQQNEQLQTSDNPPKQKSFLVSFKSLDKENRPSPEVLKKVRNPALHEKYIDQLHRREAGWRNSTRMAAANLVSKGSENAVLDRGAVKDAKGFLMLEAREVILKFQHTELNSNLCTDSEDENHNKGSDDNETEETLSGLC